MRNLLHIKLFFNFKNYKYSELIFITKKYDKKIEYLVVWQKMTFKNLKINKSLFNAGQTYTINKLM